MKQTIKQMIDMVEARRLEEEISIDAHNKLFEILEKWDGKTPNKRIATSLQKALPGRHVQWDTRYGMFRVRHLPMRENGHVDFSGPEISHLIAYRTRPVVSCSDFESFDARNGTAAFERNQARAVHDRHYYKKVASLQARIKKLEKELEDHLSGHPDSCSLGGE